MSNSKSKYINLKEAAKISGYAPDYIGQLIRKGKLPGKQIFCNIAWVTPEDSVRQYIKNKTKIKRKSHVLA
jgi:predicted DNA-binding transcriptional regulator AlpA